jgi:hypothetical protein
MLTDPNAAAALLSLWPALTPTDAALAMDLLRAGSAAGPPS